MLGAAMPPFFMATTIKVDGTLLDMPWQDDQALDPMADVDLVVPGLNSGEWTPQSQLGKGGDAAGSAKGAQGTDKI